MHHQMLNLAQAAAQAHVEPNELKHCAQRGEIAAQKRGDEFFFSAADVLEWAQRNLLCESRKALAASHREMNDARRRRTVALELASLIPVDAVDLAVPAKTKAGMIRDMADLAVKSGWVYDVEGLFAALLAREEAASTAVGEGAAFLLPTGTIPTFSSALSSPMGAPSARSSSALPTEARRGTSSSFARPGRRNICIFSLAWPSLPMVRISSSSLTRRRHRRRFLPPFARRRPSTAPEKGETGRFNLNQTQNKRIPP